MLPCEGIVLCLYGNLFQSHNSNTSWIIIMHPSSQNLTNLYPTTKNPYHNYLQKSANPVDIRFLFRNFCINNFQVFPLVALLLESLFSFLCFYFFYVSFPWTTCYFIVKLAFSYIKHIRGKIVTCFTANAN